MIATQDEATQENQAELTNRSAKKLPKPLEAAKGQVNHLERTNRLTNPLQPVNSKEMKSHPDDVPTAVTGLVREGSKLVERAERASSKGAEREFEPIQSPQPPREVLSQQQFRVPAQPAAVPLSQQAAELAHIKGLLDSGAPHEALVRLRACLAAHALSAIAEDRDALYIEALKRTSHDAEAQRAASNFYLRYPNSPQRDRIGELVAAE